jgi:nitrate/TMAO reductase-like tetraheme cytochrome c subunit
LRARAPWLSLRSRRGKLLALFLVAGFASVFTVGGVVAIGWTETADFCGRCHTMDPELKAHAISPHRELTCAECHVEPGVEGWIRAKLNGTRQLVQLVTGTFPTPIPPPGHGDLPPTDQTCRRCHEVASLVKNTGPVKMVLATRFQEDEQNTRETVALLLRPAGLGGISATRGAHWHIDSDVEYSSTDRRSRTIEVVTVTDRLGTMTTYLAASEATLAARVQPDIDRLLAANPLVRMDCIDCHNRIGHRIPSLAEAVDEAMELEKIDPSLPYIKREAIARLSVDYATIEDGEAAIDEIVGFYKSKYPLIAVGKPVTVQRAIDELKAIYALVATPAMRVSASTYPDNLGHQNSPGCFRCHDGGHFKVVDGAVSNEPIPSACATCHTFPQVGNETSTFLVGQRPQSHADRLWLFNHDRIAQTSDPSATSCGQCHTRSYCENCHNSPAVNVPHADMLFSHAAVIRRQGVQACVLCHQGPSCQRCHVTGVPGLTSGLVPGAAGSAPFAPASKPVDQDSRLDGPIWRRLPV